MEVTTSNIKTAMEILDVLENNNCTLNEVSGIFAYIEKMLKYTSKVQVGEIRARLSSLKVDDD